MTSMIAHVTDADTLVSPYAPRGSRWAVGGGPASGLYAQDDPTIPTAPSGRFIDYGPLGRGGMGSVRRVFDVCLDRIVAAKYANCVMQEEDRRLAREARIMARLAHPNIVPVFDLLRDPERGVFFTMNMVEGLTFDELVNSARAEGQVTGLVTLIRVIAGVCDAVAHAHSQGVIHCDLTPRNVLVTHAGNPCLIDWGLSIDGRPDSSTQSDGDGSPYADTYAGTPAFMSPEQALQSSGVIDERTDVYGIGGLVYCALTGLGPHEAPASGGWLRCALRPPEECAIWTHIPEQLRRVVRRALAVDPADRYRTIREMEADLKAFLVCRSPGALRQSSTAARDTRLVDAAHSRALPRAWPRVTQSR